MELKTLLDQTRARNIEIFLPSFPLLLDNVTPDSLGECLNDLSEDSVLNLDHIVALKRYNWDTLVIARENCCTYLYYFMYIAYRRSRVHHARTMHFAYAVHVLIACTIYCIVADNFVCGTV